MTIKPMSRRLEVQLVKAWQTKGDKAARERLVRQHQGLIRRLAQQYHQYKNSQIEWDDYVSEANVGLLMAIDRFDSRKGTRLSTYISFWANAFIRRTSMEQTGPFNIGHSKDVRKCWWRIGRATREIYAEGGAPTVEALANKLGSGQEAVRTVLIHRAGGHDSMDRKIKSHDGLEGREVGEEIGNGDDPENDVAQADWVRFNYGRLEKAMTRMTPRERAILEHRYLTDEPMTLADLGRKFGVSRERMRQCELKVMDGLKARMHRAA